MNEQEIASYAQNILQRKSEELRLSVSKLRIQDVEADDQSLRFETDADRLVHTHE